MVHDNDDIEEKKLSGETAEVTLESLKKYVNAKIIVWDSDGDD